MMQLVGFFLEGGRGCLLRVSSDPWNCWFFFYEN